MANSKKKDSTTKTLSLSPGERANLLNMLTFSEGTPQEVRSVIKLQDLLDFTEEEQEFYEVRPNQNGMVALGIPEGEEKEVEISKQQYELLQRNAQRFPGWRPTKPMVALLDKLEVGV